MMQSREDEVADCDLVFLDRGAYSIKIYEKVFGMADLSSLHDEIDRMSRSYKLVYVFHPDNVVLKNNAIRVEDQQLRLTLHDAFCRYLESSDIGYQLLLAENTERAGKIIGDVLEALRHQEMGPALVF